MYTIKAFADGKEYMIHNPRVKALMVGDPYYQKGDNVNGQAEFSVYPTHPYYQYVKKLTTDIIFYKDGVEKFAGRVLYDDEDSKGVKKVFVEGELAYFCDSVQRPAVYHNVSVKDYLKAVIDNHNSQVEERKQFTLGRVSVTDPNDSLYRYANWETTRETLKDKLTDRLGGHLVIRKKDGIRYLDYLNDNEFYKQNNQEIRFGKNLLDYSRNLDASGLVTCVIPLGAKLEESSIEGLEERLTIKDVNGGVDYVSDDSAVAAYGRIYKTVTWDDVTVASNLIRKGREYLQSVQFENMVLDLKAIDLNLKDDATQELEIGDLIRCVSPPHGLDSKMPLSSLKVYISNFAKNTITLGTEKQNASYTSSNSHKTEEIEKAINSIPSRGEILQEALREATNLMNDMNQNGNAIHTKSEFVVSDTPGVANAKNLWRWGLGGLAHYSNGYDGEADGVALTMDGKINGKMVMANSIVAESIDAGYRESVESQISESETAAKSHADDKVRVAKEDIENSISNLENKISLSVRSVKETVARKNYIAGGEQETLDLSKFSLSGATSVCTVEKAEFLNTKAFKLTFTGSGLITLTQSLGVLEAGNYKIAVEAAYPENAKYRPSYIQCGFTGNLATSYLSGYEADKYHTFAKSVQITRVDKSVSVSVYGYSGSVLYITDIRCLRDMQELLDDLNARIGVEVGKVSASVSDLYENSLHNYCSNGSFSNSDDKFTGWGRSSTTQVSQTTFDRKSCAKLENTTATHSISWRQSPWQKRGNITVRFKAACDPEDSDTARVKVSIDGKTFYTSAGELSDEWTQFEFISYATPSYFYTYFYNYVANTNVYITDVEILGYMTAYSESQLTILKDSIESEVKRATDKEGTLSSSIKQNANSITSKVSKGDVSSYITQYYNNVIIAFNNNSKYVQINPGEIAIYNNGVSNSKKRAVFDQNGNHYWRDNYYIGKIGTNVLNTDESKKGLNFDLEWQGSYMTWAAQDYSGAGTYTMKWTYVQKNKGWGDSTGGRLHAGCDIDMHGWTIRNASWPDGAINGTINFVQITSMNSDGTAAYWYRNCLMQFKNGILIRGTWGG